MLDWERLDASANETARAWAQSGSTKFVTFEHFLSPGFCEQLRDFGSIAGKAKSPAKRSHKHVRGKSGTPTKAVMTALQQAFFEEINSDRTVTYISRITGINPLYADDELFGGGLHETRKGGYLNVHTDFNYHPNTQKHRRLNLLLYLNPEWEEHWNGHIELWDEKMNRPVFRAAPTMNRALLFETSETSFHGHPTPLNPPPGITRRSLAVYYYSDWPAELAKRDLTGYQLTREQWVGLMGQIAQLLKSGLDDEVSIIDALRLHFQTRDIRRAFKALTGLRSAPLQKEEYWESPDGSVSIERPA